MADLIGLTEAIAAVLARARPLAAEPVPLAEATGRVLAEPARAVVDLPPFPSSAMDGYAVRSEDTPGALPVTFRIAAGRPAEAPLEPGSAMAIATGGVVPEGADAVVPIELVTEADGVLDVPIVVEPGRNVRPRGGDVTAGAEIVGSGASLGPAQVGALAAAGIAEVTCHRRPSVRVVTTGTELRPPGAELGPGEIYESNGAMLAAQLGRAGATVESVVAVADDEAAHRVAIGAGLEADVLVTSGGVSVGPHDLVRRTEGELGVEEVFWGVAVKPGKPVSFGVRGATLVFGLPGNPVSSLVACELFVLPALRALQGAADPGPRFRVGTLVEGIARDPARDVLARSVARFGAAGIELTPVLGQDSHMIVRAAAADSLVLVPRGEGAITAGSHVRYLAL
jgi:molybdopterin molybdotransferase